MPLVPIPWSSKPPFGAPLDRAHPLCGGLVGLYTFAAGGGLPADVASGVPATAMTATWGYSARTLGPRLKFNGTSSYVQIGNDAGLNAWSGPISIVAGAAPSGVANQHFLDTHDAPSTWGYYFGVISGFPMYCSLPNAQVTAATGIVDGNYHVFGVSHASTASGGVLFYGDGRPLGTATQASFPVAHGASANRYIGCNGLGSGTFLSGGIDWIGVWSRALTAREHAQLSANPWQIFMPLSIWVPDVATLFRRPLNGRAGSREAA